MAWYTSNTSGSSSWSWDHLLHNQNNNGHGSIVHHSNSSNNNIGNTINNNINSSNISQEPSPWKLAPPSPPPPEDRRIFPVHHDTSSSSPISSCIPPTSSEMASSSPCGETNPQPASLNKESSPQRAWIDPHKRGSDSWDRLVRDRNRSDLLDVIGCHSGAYKPTKVNLDSTNFHSGGKSLHCSDLQSTSLWSADHASEYVKSEVKFAHPFDEQHSSTTASGESSIGLHLGKRTYFQDSNCTPTATKTLAKPNNRPSKRPRASANQVPRCQVEGCNADLSSSKDYHRRHKVCETHSKAGKAIVANQEQRFCQQCSRFHLLVEFDEAKRSCRRRLAGHNERRRKPQPDPLLQARLQSGYQVWPFLPHSRLSGIPSLWQGSIYNYRLLGGNYNLNNRFEEKPKYDVVEAQFHSKGLSHHAANDRLPLMFFQNSKETIPLNISHASDKCSHNEYISGSVDALYDCPTVVSSTSSFDLSGLRASSIANTQVTDRVTDSGRALSLLSPHTRSLYASNVIPLDIVGCSSFATNIANPDSSSQQFMKGANQHDYDYSDKLLSAVPVQSSHNHIASNSLSPGCLISFGKIHNEESTIGHGFLEGQSLLTAMPGRAEDVKHTIDLMRISSQAVQGAADEKPMAFQLGNNAFGDIQYMYESTF